MKRISELVYRIDAELEDAKEYAEMYVEAKAKGDSYANTWKEISQQELQHSTNVHNKALAEIDELKRVFTPPIAMQEQWDKTHKEYVEKLAWIKQMLSM